MEKKATWKILQSYFARLSNHQIHTLDLTFHGNAFWAFEPFFERLETLKIGFRESRVVGNPAALVDESVVELPSLQTLHISSPMTTRYAADMNRQRRKVMYLPPPNLLPSILSASTRLVDLSCNPVASRDLDCLGKIVQANPLLQKLRFAISKTKSAPDNNTLVKAIRNHKSLQSISIFLMGRASSSVETQRIVEASLLWTPKLQEFAFGMTRDVKLGEWIVECLANTRIVTFRYVRNEIFPENTFHLSESINGGGVRSIMDGLTRNQFIQTIDLTGASGAVADNGRMAVLLAQHPTLQTLRFNHYNQSNHAMAFSGLSENRTIKSIACYLLPGRTCNRNYDDLVRDLGQGLEGNKTLERIVFRHSLPCTPKDDPPRNSKVPPLDAVVVFCRGLASHPTLRHFVFPNLNFGTNLKHVKEAVRQNTALQEIQILWRQNLWWQKYDWLDEIEAMLATNTVLNNYFLAATGQETNEVLLPHILAKASHRNIDLTYRCIRDRVGLFVQALLRCDSDE